MSAGGIRPLTAVGSSQRGWLGLGIGMTAVIGAIGLGTDRAATAFGWHFPSLGYAVGILVWKLLTLGVLALAVRRSLGPKQTLSSLGFTNEPGWTADDRRSHTGLAILGLALAGCLGVPMSLLGSSLASASSYGVAHHAGPGLIVTELLAVYPLTVLAEETVFRGWLQPRLGRWGPLISGVLWAGQHLQQWRTIPSLIPLGIGLGVIRWWRGNIRLTSGLHYASDGLFFLLNYA